MTYIYTCTYYSAFSIIYREYVYSSNNVENGNNPTNNSNIHIVISNSSNSNNNINK